LASLMRRGFPAELLATLPAPKPIAKMPNQLGLHRLI